MISPFVGICGNHGSGADENEHVGKFSLTVDPNFVGVGRWALRTVDTESGTLATVLDDGNINTLPRWSADGSALLFHRFVFGETHQFILASVGADGSGYQPLTRGGNYDDTDVDWYRK